MRETLILNSFHMAAASHLYDGGWRNPADEQSKFYELDTWTKLAATLERGCFDSIFFADVMGSDAAFGDSWDIYPERGIQFPVHDPVTLAAALIPVTEHLGLTFTSSIIQEPPFTFAKRVSTLDHLSGGRIGWNIVTGHTANGFQNLGYDNLLPHDERYAMAEEYVEVLYKLWEGSWDEGALVSDREKGIFADPRKIHTIDHRGKHFAVRGPSITIPSPQRTPVLFQAGSSPTGRGFAGQHAEGAFVICLNPEGLRQAAAQMRKVLAAAGRQADDLTLIQGMSFVVGSTEAEAKRKAEDQDQYLDLQAVLARVSRDVGIDLSGAELDQPLDTVKIERVQGMVAFLNEALPGRRILVKDLPLLYSTRIIGTPEQIADELSVWREAGMGGINVESQVVPGTDAEFVDYVVPELQKRGLAQREYAAGTLREKLFPGRGPLLNGRHPAADFRGAFTPANS